MRHTSKRMRVWLRAGLVALGIPNVMAGIWARAAPENFHEEFPGFGRHWLTPLGPYNEHYVTDFGVSLAALGLLLLWAAVVLERRLVQVALVVYLVLALPHFIFHVTTLDELSTTDNVLNMIVLGVGVVLPVALLVATRKADGAA